MLANAWLASGEGGGSPIRPGFNRFDARNALVKHHNFRGGECRASSPRRVPDVAFLLLTEECIRPCFSPLAEAVFMASRRWHHAKAQSHAARMRLTRALAEADEAEQAELMALRSMGIGRRQMASFSSSQRGASMAPPMKPGGYREALANRIAAFEQETYAPTKSASKIPSRARTERSPSKDKPKSSAADARSAWRAKNAGGGDLSPTGAAEIKAPEVKKTRGAAKKAATTR